ncbi:hypothetical protein, partial [Brevibacillus massiliensis]|uniref:hypothetical protein n=1 Tax=Brevibacillus massiliensis TaxID=1118054 RepID=UPI0003665CB4
MARGGKREGAGRKAQGITRKVSLTLTAEEWEQIDKFDGTVAAFLRQLMKQVTEIKERQPLPVEKGNSNHNDDTERLTRRTVEELWQIYLSKGSQHTP